MNELKRLLFSNPELIRNLRIELRPNRMLTAGIISAVVALLVLPSIFSQGAGGRAPVQFGPISGYAFVVLRIQGLVLSLGGAFSCWRAIRRERELNTFDYQRVSRLTPLELAVGKLLGAPALSYFVALCFLPAALFSVLSSGGLFYLLRAYLLLWMGSVVFHSFALMLSMVQERGGVISGIVLLVLTQVFSAIGWMAGLAAIWSRAGTGAESGVKFYGIDFPPVLLFALIDAAFIAWFLLATARNIKRDPETYRLYSPVQALGFAAYCNFLWIGFYPREFFRVLGGPGFLVFLSALPFYLVGVATLRSRESARRCLRESGVRELQVWNLLEPLRFLLGGALLSGLLLAALSIPNAAAVPFGPWISPERFWARSIYHVLFFTVWLARDLLYLQWMKVRTTRGSLRKAFLYLAVFYGSVAIILRAGLASSDPSQAAFTAWFSPFTLMRSLSMDSWEKAFGMWMFALAMQVGAAVLFGYFYRQELAALLPQPRRAAPAAPAQLTSSPI